MPILFLLLLAVPAPSDWSQWRGPSRDGHAPDFKTPAAWPAQPRELWRVPLAKGYGGAVVGDGRVYVLGAAPARELVLCFDAATGKELWRHESPLAYRANPAAMAYETGPFSTPLLVGDRLITVGVAGLVQCFEARTGKLLWSHEGLGDLTDERVLFCGHSGSPLLVGKTIVVHVGNEKLGRMSAYNLADGAVAWQWTEDLPGYASPFLGQLVGREVMIALCQNALFGLDPATGKTLFRHPYQVKWRENIPDPVLVGDLIVLTGREPRATNALRVTRDGNAWRLEEAWRNEALFAYIASPVRVGSRLFGLAHANKGQLFALEASSGRELWRGEGRMGETVALVAVGERLLCLTEEGRLLIYDVRETPRQLAHYKLEGASFWGFPAVAGNQLILRERDQLICLTF